MSGLNKLRHLLSARDGTITLEFAFIAPVFLMLTFSAIEMGIGFYNASTIQWAMDRISRLVLLDPDITQSALETQLANELDGMTQESPQLTYLVDNSGALPVLELSTIYTHQVHIPFVTAFDISYDIGTRTPMRQN